MSYRLTINMQIRLRRLGLSVGDDYLRLRLFVKELSPISRSLSILPEPTMTGILQNLQEIQKAFAETFLF